MILKKCEDLHLLATRYQEHQQQVGLVDTLRPRRQDLEDLKTRLATEADRIAVFRDHKLLSADDLRETRNTINKARESLDKVRTSFTEDPINLTRGRDYSHLTKRFGEICDALQAVATTAWRQHVKKACPAAEDRELQRFARTERDLVRRIRDLQTRADGIRLKIPTSNAEVEEAIGLFEELRKAIAKLPNITDNPEVRAFLDAAIQEEGARLSLLTSTVVEWLYSEGRDDHYRIWPRR